MIIIARAHRVCGTHYTREGTSSQYCDIRYSVLRAKRGTECAMTLPFISIVDLGFHIHDIRLYFALTAAS